ncbi:hypothetical protein ELH77_19480 [Rhizobium ruizarguesonis]|nr:hypothetical protein ELH77_19480 [Rhizobium ruizarguesonis]
MKSASLAIIVCAFALAGCQTTALNCAGWSPPPKVNNPVRLVQEEPALSRWTVATDTFGRKQRCWK